MLQRLKSWMSLFFWLERILFEPGAEVGLDLDGAALVDLGGAGFDANHAGAEIEIPRQQFADLAIFPVEANPCKEREGKEWNEEALGLEGGGARRDRCRSRERPSALGPDRRSRFLAGRRARHSTGGDNHRLQA